MSLNNYYRLCVGDWSDDGHGKTEDFFFHCSHDRKDIIKAYKASEKKLGVGLTNKAKHEILGDYEDSKIPAEFVKVLSEAGCSFEEFGNILEDDGDLYCGAEDVFRLFMEMVRLSLPDFQYTIAKPPQSINGFWQDDFNEGVGYGVFHG